MATNLVSEITEVLSSTVVSRIASGFGLNQSSTQKGSLRLCPHFSLLSSLMSQSPRGQPN